MKNKKVLAAALMVSILSTNMTDSYAMPLNHAIQESKIEKQQIIDLTINSLNNERLGTIRDIKVSNILELEFLKDLDIKGFEYLSNNEFLLVLNTDNESILLTVKEKIDEYNRLHSKAFNYKTNSDIAQEFNLPTLNEAEPKEKDIEKASEFKLDQEIVNKIKKVFDKLIEQLKNTDKSTEKNESDIKDKPEIKDNTTDKKDIEKPVKENETTDEDKSDDESNNTDKSETENNSTDESIKEDEKTNKDESETKDETTDRDDTDENKSDNESNTTDKPVKEDENDKNESVKEDNTIDKNDTDEDKSDDKSNNTDKSETEDNKTDKPDIKDDTTDKDESVKENETTDKNDTDKKKSDNESNTTDKPVKEDKNENESAKEDETSDKKDTDKDKSDDEPNITDKSETEDIKTDEPETKDNTTDKDDTDKPVKEDETSDKNDKDEDKPNTTDKPETESNIEEVSEEQIQKEAEFLDKVSDFRFNKDAFDYSKMFFDPDSTRDESFVTGKNFNHTKFRKKFLDLLNEERRSKNLNELKLDEKLEKGSDIRSKELAEWGHIRTGEKLENKHTRLNGDSFRTAFDYLDDYEETEANYLGENLLIEEMLPENDKRIVRDKDGNQIDSNEYLADEEKVAEEMFQIWKESPGHYRNMMHEGYETMWVSAWIEEENSQLEDRTDKMDSLVGVQILSAKTLEQTNETEIINNDQVVDGEEAEQLETEVEELENETEETEQLEDEAEEVEAE